MKEYKDKGEIAQAMINGIRFKDYYGNIYKFTLEELWDDNKSPFRVLTTTDRVWKDIGVHWAHWKDFMETEDDSVRTSRYDY